MLTSFIEIISFQVRLQCNEIYNRVLEFRFCHFCFMSLCVRLLDIDKCLQLFGGYHDGNQTWIGIKPSIILMCIIIHLSHCVRSSTGIVWLTFFNGNYLIPQQQKTTQLMSWKNILNILFWFLKYWNESFLLFKFEYFMNVDFRLSYQYF